MIRGKVQAIPVVDETLTIEGQCADAKVTGDKFKEMDEKKVNVADIVDNLTTNDAEKPLSSAMGKALKKLIDEMTEKKVDNADIVNDLLTSDEDKPLSSAMGKELKRLIDEMTAKGVSFDNTSTGLESVNVQDAIKEVKLDLATYEASTKLIYKTDLLVETNVDSVVSKCYRWGAVCVCVFDFTTKQEISANGVPIFADLPRPNNDYVFEVHGTNDKVPYWLGVYRSGHLSTANVNNIPAGTRLMGAFTYFSYPSWNE